MPPGRELLVPLRSRAHGARPDGTADRPADGPAERARSARGEDRGLPSPGVAGALPVTRGLPQDAQPRRDDGVEGTQRNSSPSLRGRRIRDGPTEQRQSAVQNHRQNAGLG